MAGPYGDIALELWGLLPRPLRAMDREGLVAEAKRWLSVWGELVEHATDTVVQTVIGNRHPVSATEAALAFLAEERWLPRMDGEALASWRARVRQAFALHEEGGTNAAVVRVLGLLGFDGAEVYEHREHLTWYAGVASYDGAFNYSDPSDNWALFSVDIPLDDGEMPAALLARLRGAINKVKAGHALLAALRFATSDLLDDQDVTDQALGLGVDLALEDVPWHGTRYDGAVTYSGGVDFDTEDDVLEVTVT